MGHKHKAQEQGGEVGSPLWMISFTDAMTNLLTFFILLVTFAAFGDRDKNTGHASGFGPRTAGASILPNQGPSLTGATEPPPATSQMTTAGSEKPTSVDPETMTRPRAPIGILDTEVYHDRKIIYLPSKFVFYGWGKFITEPGQIRLAQIAPLLRTTTCQIVVGESSYLHPNHPMFARQNLGPQRSWAVIQYFIEKEGIAADRFSISAEPVPAQSDLNEEPVIELTLFARKVYP
jgi:chemotaxis protein MotB